MSSDFFTVSLPLKIFYGAQILKLRTIQLVSLFILFFVLITVESTCPYNCNCTTTSVSCVNRNIGKIPNFDSIDIDPITIDLSGNSISLIGFDDFQFGKSYLVKELYLNNTNIIDIDSRSFNELENLQELYLGNNLLNSVPTDFIEHLNNMVLLDLSGNYFDGDIPVIKSKSLEVLTIIDCHLTTFTIDSLVQLPNLKLLSLQMNNIQIIDMLRPIPNNMLLLKLPYESWACSCETVKIFNYLGKNKYVDVSEPYRCHKDAKSVRIFESQNQREFCEKNFGINLMNKNILSQKSDDRNDTSDIKQTHLGKPSKNYTLEKKVFDNDNNYSSKYEYYLVEYYLCVFTFIVIFIAIAVILSSLLLPIKRTNNKERYIYVTIT